MERSICFHGMDFERVVREKLKISDGPILFSNILDIKSLNLSECDFLSADFETLYLFKNLEELVFEKNTGVIDFNLFAPLKNLKYLIVGGSIFSDVGFKNINALKKLPLLEYLSIGDFGEINLAPIGEVEQIKEICIGWGNLVTNADSIKKLKNLTSLELYDVKIKSLDFVNELSNDVELDFAGIDIETPFNIESLKRFKQCEYEMLSINGNQI